MDEKTLFTTPSVWPQWPYLRVERRTVLRPSQKLCMLLSDDLYSVDPVIYFTDAWPPGEDFLPEREAALNYDSMDELVADGWKPYLHL